MAGAGLTRARVARHAGLALAACMACAELLVADGM
jgi:hypothetical protein